MKTLFSKSRWIFPVLLIAGLIAFPSGAFSAASDAALLWWSRIVPTLLPYLIAVSLLCRSGVFMRIPKRILPFALFGFGALGGYPVGAKLARSLSDRGILSQQYAEKVAILCNLPNPVFLLSVVSVGFFGSTRCALPLLIGVYVPALLFSLPLLRLPFQEATDRSCDLRAGDLPDAIADGVRSVGTIGGCLVLASVLYALLHAIGIPTFLHRLTGVAEDTAGAALVGLFEMTCGIRAAAALSLSLPVRLAFAAFFTQFGGLSVALQVQSQTPLHLPRYIVHKLPVALLSAILVRLLTSVFIAESVVPTFASVSQMHENAYALLSVVLSAAVGLLFIFVFTVRFSKKRA